MKKHCKTFDRENKIHRVKITSDPDPYQNKTDPKHWLLVLLNFTRLREVELNSSFENIFAEEMLKKMEISRLHAENNLSLSQTILRQTDLLGQLLFIFF